jgi:hypothetical protein
MKVYLLYYDTDYGDREEWNTFHTPCEVFDSAEKRQARIDFIRAQVDQDGEPVEYEFHTVDQDIMSDSEIQKWSE